MIFLLLNVDTLNFKHGKIYIQFRDEKYSKLIISRNLNGRENKGI